jgi:hypothetical protein
MLSAQMEREHAGPSSPVASLQLSTSSPSPLFPSSLERRQEPWGFADFSGRSMIRTRDLTLLPHILALRRSEAPIRFRTGLDPARNAECPPPNSAS